MALIPWEIDEEPVWLRIEDWDPEYTTYSVVVCDKRGIEILGVLLPDSDDRRLHEAVMEMSRMVEEER